ncbi:hypothetical protein SDC9_120987 [bioreactor metagenome]|uniref:Uncharacterized protein n=1 Tax=bioreactor metagenome TaxID=1076179 RepID=A0A645CAS5_9ZZZZ
MLGNSDLGVVGQHGDIGYPQAMRQLPAALDVKALDALALQV